MSPSILMKPVDTLVERPKTEIWGWAIGLLRCPIVFIYLYKSFKFLEEYCLKISN